MGTVPCFTGNLVKQGIVPMFLKVLVQQKQDLNSYC